MLPKRPPFLGNRSNSCRRASSTHMHVQIRTHPRSLTDMQCNYKGRRGRRYQPLHAAPLSPPDAGCVLLSLSLSLPRSWCKHEVRRTLMSASPLMSAGGPRSARGRRGAGARSRVQEIACCFQGSRGRRQDQESRAHRRPPSIVKS